MKRATNIIVEDYLYDGNFIFGTFYECDDVNTYYILDDGDIFTEKVLKENGYKVHFISSEKIIEWFKNDNQIKN